ncbi:hypothetical protein AB1Y20_009706 [Prymnesium parvum]|uniref:Glutaredoxin-like protein n=1 Tax=Prymnesium parvum TaxID=97485 RepID=A0AB34K4N9_PRYPA
MISMLRPLTLQLTLPLLPWTPEATSPLARSGVSIPLLLTPRARAHSAMGEAGERQSVSGMIYSAPEGTPHVRLYTKEGCTLCDQAKEVLVAAARQRPHTLEAVDITDPENSDFWARYKYDIPVLTIDEIYWAKHRITLDDALDALALAEVGQLMPSKGEPDAERLERRLKDAKGA